MDLVTSHPLMWYVVYREVAPCLLGVVWIQIFANSVTFGYGLIRMSERVETRRVAEKTVYPDSCSFE